ncbi:MAG: alpha-glucan family phosphorylase [Candidatus Eisenbacteria bacterium]
MRSIDIRTAPSADIQIPVEFQGLYDLAYNFWWTWSQAAKQLFQRIDPVRWGVYRNPVELLINVEPHRWDALLVDGDFAATYHAVMDEFRAYLSDHEGTWFHRRYPEYDKGPIAYFSTEFGWHECLSIYSGGLGILAGDHCKAASDLGLPFVGVGLMYGRGYFHQTIDADGHQQHHYREYDFRRVPILPISTPSGHTVHVSVDYPGRTVHFQLWKAMVGRVPVILLDSDVRENDPADRPITSILYIRGRQMRLCQEIALGMGGVKALRALGIEPSVWHMNEGHSAFLAFERIDEMLRTGSETSFHDARRRVQRNTVFTTHTPVPAGNEAFDGGLILRYLDKQLERWQIDSEHLFWLGDARTDAAAEPAAVPVPQPVAVATETAAPPAGGSTTETPEAPTTGTPPSPSDAGPEAPPTATAPRSTNGNGTGPGSTGAAGPFPSFNLTALALRTSRLANGVSAMHGKVARSLWNGLDYGEEEQTVEIGHITNGVHGPTWIGPEITALLSAHLGSSFPYNLDHPSFSETVGRIANADLWAAHRAQKRRLIHVARRKLMEQFARHGRSPDSLREVETILSEDALTIGFARRFATYKRAALIFHDTKRLGEMVRAEGRPIQIVFAGKAHPADRPGQQLIREIIGTSQTDDFLGRVVFLEDYDMGIARYLVQGVDLWLNTPRRPQEASGTSGMKAALNGVLNCSILDGWWCEGYDASHGWAFGKEDDRRDPAVQDTDDAAMLYRVLGDEIVPCFYEQDPETHVPHAWVERMKKAIGMLAPRFNTARMVREYAENYYLPATEE